MDKRVDDQHDRKTYEVRRISNRADLNDKQSDSIFAGSMQELYAQNLSKQAEEGPQGAIPPHSSQVTLSTIFGNK